jgi:hypothetical protein
LIISPRIYLEAQQKTLEALGRQVVVQLELKRVSAHLATALDKIELMAGLIPICSYCKGIRNDQGYWSTVEKFIAQYSDVEFTHGVCNTCMRQHFPEVADVLLAGEKTKSQSEYGSEPLNDWVG